MKFTYIFKDRIHDIGSYPSRWHNPSTWYDLGLVLGYIVQVAAGFGIGWFIKCVLVTLGIV